MKILLRAAFLSAVIVEVPACGGDPFPAPAPPKFQMSSPPDGAIGVDGTPVFSWTTSAGAASYTLQVATDGGFTAPVVDQPGLTATSFGPGVPLSPGTVYFWRVLAASAGGTVAAAGAPFSFTTLSPVPGDFMLTAPANGTLGASTTPTFSWTSSLGTASYRLQVSTDSGFGTLVIDLTGLTATTATPGVLLAPTTVYFWRVLAVSSSVVVATGAPWSFTTGVGASPGPFSLLSPVSGAITVDPSPTYEWTASSGATSYRLEVAFDAAFQATVTDLSGITAITLTPTDILAPQTTFFWRVTASNGAGTTVASPAPLSFTTR